MYEVVEATTHFTDLSPEGQEVAIKKNKYNVLKGMVDMETPVGVLLEMLKPDYTASCLKLSFYRLNIETLEVVST